MTSSLVVKLVFVHRESRENACGDCARDADNIVLLQRINWFHMVY